MENQVMNNNVETSAQQISDKNAGKAKAGFILGLISIAAWFIPLIGYPVTVVGLVLSILGVKSSKKKLAIAGIILTVIFLIVTIINSVLGAKLMSSKIKS